MTILDAAGLIAYFVGEPAEPQVRALLRTGDIVVTAVNLGEVRDKLERALGVDAHRIETAIEQLLESGLGVLPVEMEDGLLAGRVRAAEYNRTRNDLSLADCILLARALRHGAAIASSDLELVTTARRLGVQIVPLPNSAGLLP